MTNDAVSTAPASPARRKLSGKPLFYGALAVAFALVAYKLSRPPPLPDAAAGVSRGTPYLDGEFIRYSPEFAQREQLKAVPVEPEELTPEISLAGAVTYDARRVVAIGARIEGRVRTVTRVEGEDVKASEVMAELESVELGRAQAEVLKARAQLGVAELDEQRERRLADAKISPERDAQYAHANAEARRVERAAAERAVEAMGGTVGGEAGVLKLKSPIAGRVIEMHIKRGESVEPSDTLFVVADLSRVWVELTVYERQLVAIREGDAVQLTFPSIPGKAVATTVEYVSEVIDPTTRTGHVRLEVDNLDGAVRPGLSVTAVVRASGRRANSLVVPKSAITRVDGKPTVFVELEPGRVQPRTVELGAEAADRVAVLGGLTEGQRVISGGVLALKAEVFR